MKVLIAVALLAGLGATAGADVLYQQIPNPAGGSFMSAWWDPDGSNYDRYVWDAFTLGLGGEIRAIEWRGTYGPSGPPTSFTVAIYGSIPAGTQPDFSRPPLVEYVTGNDAGATYAGVFGGAAMYDYTYILPVPFAAQAATRYWLQIEGWQPGFPDWSLAAAQSGDGSHFLCEHNNLVEAVGVPTGCWFTVRTGDVAFALFSAPPTGVEVPGSPLALGPVVPNPTAGRRLEVSITLPTAGPAQLGLYDVSGRLLVAEDIGALGAGSHVVDLARGVPVPAGIHFLRLRHGGRVVATRVAIVR